MFSASPAQWLTIDSQKGENAKLFFVMHEIWAQHGVLTHDNATDCATIHPQNLTELTLRWRFESPIKKNGKH